MITIEILATIFSILVLLKIFLTLTMPRVRIKIAEAFFKRISIFTAVYVALTGIIGYYLFSNVDIVIIAAVMLFTSFLFGFSLVLFWPELLKKQKELLSNTNLLMKKFWFLLLIWLIFSLLVLYKIFLGQ